MHWRVRATAVGGAKCAGKRKQKCSDKKQNDDDGRVEDKQQDTILLL